MPKYHVLPFRVCLISGSRVLVLFFVELGADMIVASTMVPCLRSMPAYSGGFRPLIPEQAVHRFRSKPSIDSGARRPLIPGIPSCHSGGIRPLRTG
jgi:hypothetical protein